MFNIFRPLIFKLSPEAAHTMAIKALKFGYIPALKSNKSSLLETSIFSKKIHTPIGIAAVFDKNGEGYNPLFNLGFGFVEVGNVTTKPQY